MVQKKGKISARDLAVNGGAFVFVASIVAMVVGRAVYGYEAVAWVTVLALYPALLIIFAAIGFGDLVQLARHFGANGVKSEDALGLMFLGGRGVSFTFAFVVFARMELRLLLDAV